MKKTNTNTKNAKNKYDKTSNKKAKALTATEKKTLTAAITAMRNALKSFLVIGKNHHKVSRLIESEYGTVAAFCDTALGVSESYYYRQVRATDVYLVLEEAKIQPLPHAESVCRPVTLNVLDDLIKECPPKNVKGQKAETVLVDIWNRAITNKLNRLNKAKLPAGSRITAAEITKAKSDWKSLHSGTGKPEKNDPVKPSGKPEKKDLQNDHPELPDGLPSETPGSYSGPEKGHDSKAGTNTKDLTREELINKVAEQRTELAKLRKENAALALAARNNKADWHTAPLTKEVFEAGKKVVAAKCLETNDADKIAALADLEKIIFG